MLHVTRNIEIVEASIDHTDVVSCYIGVSIESIVFYVQDLKLELIGFLL